MANNYTQLWNEEFKKNTAFIDRHSLKYVCEIGSFESLTTNYIADELLSPDGTVVAIDPLDSEYVLDCDDSLFKDQYDRFIENSEKNKDKIWLIRKQSKDALPALRENSFDLIYVDGDHTFNSVYIDGTEAFKICKVGGYILFDDYLFNPATFGVKKAIDKVLEENPNHRLLLKLNQVLVQKLPEGSATEDGQDEYQSKTTEILFNENTIHAAYCNLDIRSDRNEKMQTELTRTGLQNWIQRQRSFYWEELYEKFSDEEKERVQVMFKRTAGAIGCYYSQMEVMKEALRQDKHAIVLEDDLVFCDDFPARLKIIYKFLNQHEWDVFWFGGTYHIEPTWHKSIEGKHTHPEMQICTCNLNRDWEETNNPHIVRAYGAFSTHAYMVNKSRIQHVLNLLENRMPISMGIDWTFLLEQPNLFAYAFNPGCIKQYDSMSNISNAFAVQSGFANLGSHWFQPSM